MHYILEVYLIDPVQAIKSECSLMLGASLSSSIVSSPDGKPAVGIASTV